jgi:hypothetical protein
LVLLGVVSGAQMASGRKGFCPPESFMVFVFPLASLLLPIGVIVLSELKDSCDLMS